MGPCGWNWKYWDSSSTSSQIWVCLEISTGYCYYYYFFLISVNNNNASNRVKHGPLSVLRFTFAHGMNSNFSYEWY